MPRGSLQEDGPALGTLTRVAAVEHTVDIRVAALVVAALPPERRAEASAVARGLNAPVSAARASAVLARLAQASATIPLPPSADSLMQLLELCDAFRRPDDFVRVLPALNALDVTGEATQLADQLTNALPIALRVKVSDAFLDGKTGAEIGAAIRDARIAAIAEVLTRPDTNPRPAG